MANETHDTDIPVDEARESSSGASAVGARRESAVRRFFRRDNWIAIVSLFTGIALSMGVPVWRVYYVEPPVLMTEIRTIDRVLPSGFTVNAFKSDSKFHFLAHDRAALRRQIGQIRQRNSLSVGTPLEILLRHLVSEASEREPSIWEREPSIDVGQREEIAVTLDELRQTIQLAKYESAALLDRIEKTQTAINELSLENRLSRDALQKYAGELHEQSYSARTTYYRGVKPLIDTIYPDGILQTFEELDAWQESGKPDEGLIKKANEFLREQLKIVLKAYQKEHEALTNRRSKLTSSLPTAEQDIDELEERLLTRQGFFTLNAVLRNEGRSNISIKKPALLRVFIGVGNYVDLQLTLQGDEEYGEIPAQGARLMSFRSRGLDAMPAESRDLINRYWGQRAHAILFVENVFGKVCASNPIQFASGLYAQAIYDRLAIEARKEEYARPAR